MARVHIRGQGVAAYCCAHLLDAAGLPVILQTVDRPTVPALLLGESTQQLACDIFAQPDLFAGLPQIEKRVVAWGVNTAAVTLPHRAIVISEVDLSTRLCPQPFAGDLAEPDWRVLASRPLPASCIEHPFGDRTATALAVTLKDAAPACWIESLSAGWLFLIGGGDTGWLLAVGGPPESLLAESRVVAAQIQSTSQAGGAWPAHPRISNPLCGPGWLACGTAAMAFDPICGDGTGYAVREGILAAAVIRAAAQGGDVADLLAHYRMRMIAGFRRHLELCREFYRTGGDGPWWRTELDALEKGVQWCGAELNGQTFRYRLKGFDLQPAG
jgi:hypothetical protein